MENNFCSISSEQITTYEVNKSKFIAIIFPTNSIIFLEQKIKDIKKEYKKATHYTFAYSIKTNDVVLEKCFDDGEPFGTAGQPILNAIKKNNLINVAIIVVRYFGGVKLGAGGLIRAYSKSAMKSILSSDIIPIKELTHFNLQLEISELKALNDIKNNKYIYNLEIQYGDRINISGDIESDKQNFINILRKN